MSKVLKCFAVAAAIMLVITGCGKKSGGAGTADLIPADIAASILEKVDFKKPISLAEGDIANNFYALDDKVTDHAIYIDGTGSSAEEIAVLKAASEDDIGHLKEIINKRLEKLTFSFQTYRPDEMAKINDPVIVTKGNILVFVTADDQKQAEDVVAELLGN